MNCTGVNRCKTCNWRYNDYDTEICVCEDEDVFKSDTQYTDNCIGYLDENFEKKLMNIYNECVKLLSKMKYEELLNIKNILLSLKETKL